MKALDSGDGGAEQSILLIRACAGTLSPSHQMPTVLGRCWSRVSLPEGRQVPPVMLCVASLVIHIVGQSSDTEQLPEPLLPLWYIGIRCCGWLLSVSGCCVPQPVRGGISSLVAPGISTEL